MRETIDRIRRECRLTTLLDALLADARVQRADARVQRAHARVQRAYLGG